MAKQNRRPKRTESRNGAEAADRQRWTIRKGVYAKWADRQIKTIQEQAARYSLPIGSRTIYLPDFVRAVHDFFARHGHRLAKDGDALLVGPESPALERYRDERAKLAKLDRRERERELLRRDYVHEFLGRLSHVLREATGALRRQYGNDAAEIVNNALDDVEAWVDSHFSDQEK